MDIGVQTFAEGIATGSAYELTFAALREGLRDFIKVTDAEMYAAIRELISITHNLPEGARAARASGAASRPSSGSSPGRARSTR